MDAFRSCPSCRRHVRVEEASCPFCAALLSPVRVRSVAWPRLARGAMLAFGATLAVNCGSEVTVPADDDQGTGAGTTGVGGAGGEGGEGVGASGAAGGSGIGGGIAPAYGSPGVGGATGVGGGAGGETSNGGGFPLYGAAPFPEDDDDL